MDYSWECNVSYTVLHASVEGGHANPGPSTALPLRSASTSTPPACWSSMGRLGWPWKRPVASANGSSAGEPLGEFSLREVSVVLSTNSAS